MERGDEGMRASKVFMLRSLEEVWSVRGEYLFQSSERTSAPWWARIVAVAVS